MAQAFCDENDSTARLPGAGDRSWIKLQGAAERCSSLFDDAEAILAELDDVTLALLHQSVSPLHPESIRQQTKNRKELISSKRIRIMLAGEESSGKTTLVNILMGGSYLPVSFLGNTSIICHVRNSDYTRECTVKFAERDKPPLKFGLSQSERGDPGWQRLRYMIEYRMEDGEFVPEDEEDVDNKLIEEVIIDWPLNALMCVDDVNPMQLGWMASPPGDRSETRRKEPFRQLPRTIPNVKENLFDRGLTDSGSSIGDETRKLYGVSTAQPKTFQTDPDETQVKHIYSTPVDTETESAMNPLLSSSSTELSADDSTSAPISKARGDTMISCACDEDLESERFKVELLDCPGIVEDADCHATLQHCASCDAFVVVVDISAFQVDRKHKLHRLLDNMAKRLSFEGKPLHQSTVLVIFNKWDVLMQKSRIEQDKIKKNAIAAIREKFELLDEKKHIVFVAAEKLLDDTTRRMKFLGQIRAFVNDTAFHTIEQNCLWLLNVLEVCHALVGAGKNWAERRERSSEVEDNLKRCLGEINEIEDRLKLKNEDYRVVIVGKIKDLLDSMKSNKIIVNDIVASLRRIDTDQPLTKEKLEVFYGEIWKKIAKNEQVKERVAEHDTCAKHAFKKEEKRIEDLVKRLQVAVYEKQRDPTLGSFLLPVIAMGALRLFHTVAPIALIAVPLSTIPLIALAIKEEWDEMTGARDEQRNRDLYNEDRTKFFEEIVHKYIQSFSKQRSKSPFFVQLLGESKMEALEDVLQQLEKDCQHLRNLLKGKTSTNQELQKKLKANILNTLQIYSDEIMEHEIHQDDLQVDTTIPLGSGGQAKVFLGSLARTHLDTNRQLDVAVKRFTSSARMDRNGGMSSGALPENFDMYKECLILRELERKKSPYVVSYFGSCYTLLDAEKGAFILDLIMEKFERNLADVIKDASELKKTEDIRVKQFLSYALQCAEGLRIVHQCNYIHRDVKPSNFLVGGDRVVITDVGNAKADNQIVTHMRGTRCYNAPEIVKHQSLHDVRTDVYSLGLVFWELWYRLPVYEEANTGQGETPKLNKKSPRDKTIKEILSGCLEIIPKKRLGIQEVVNKLKVYKRKLGMV